jgi:serine/threonine protein phosphatase 1
MRTQSKVRHQELFDRIKTMLKAPISGANENPLLVEEISPTQMIMVVGDVHGCETLLGQQLRKIDAFIAKRQSDLAAMPQLVFVGDYVDRGESSAQVLNRLFELQQDLPDNVTCLMGNHERMMIEFLDDPVGRGVRWLRNGGLQTLASYNIGGVSERSDVEALTEASYALEAAMPTGLLDWLRNLPLMYRSGNVCVVHAAMNPRKDADDQSNQSLLWGQKDFMTTARDDGLWVVHGHTIVREPEIAPSRISVDTGAYHSGRLTVAIIDEGSCEFL